MKVSRRSVLTAFAVAVTLPVAASAQPAVTLEQIMATLRTIRHVQARYVERRTLRALRAPLQSAGTLRYDAPDRLEKIGDPVGTGQDERPGEHLTIAGDQVTMERGRGEQPVTLAMADHPELGGLVGILRATLSGDGVALRAGFEITVSGSPERWQLVLTPRDPAARRLLAWIRVAGDGPHLTAIDTQETDGDHSELLIVEPAP